MIGLMHPRIFQQFSPSMAQNSINMLDFPCKATTSGKLVISVGHLLVTGTAISRFRLFRSPQKTKKFQKTVVQQQRPG